MIAEDKWVTKYYFLSVKNASPKFNHSGTNINLLYEQSWVKSSLKILRKRTRNATATHIQFLSLAESIVELRYRGDTCGEHYFYDFFFNYRGQEGIGPGSLHRKTWNIPQMHLLFNLGSYGTNPTPKRKFKGTIESNFRNNY